MFRPRVIPVLLLKNLALVKTLRFGRERYIGDPINAVRIFNDLLADELVFLDIEASRQGRLISLDFIRNVGEESNMPFAVGGGTKNLNDIRKILEAGAEKVVLGHIALANPTFVRNAAEEFGSSTIAVCLDIKKTFWGRKKLFSLNGKKEWKEDPLEFAQEMQKMGAGELIIQAIDQDGTMKGYDIDLLKQVSEPLEIPVVALGGAGSLDDLRQAYKEGGVSALAAGSLFVFHGPRRGVLISYLDQTKLQTLFQE